jgi:hypothetical protein
VLSISMIKIWHKIGSKTQTYTCLVCRGWVEALKSDKKLTSKTVSVCIRKNKKQD